MKRLSARSWTWRYRYSVGIVGLAASASIISLHLHTQHVNYTVMQQQANTQAMASEYDAKIAKLTSERKAKKAQAKQVAEASKAATPEMAHAMKCPLLALSHNNPAHIDIIVNKSHCLSPLSYAPSDLVSVYGHLVSAKIASHLQDMFVVAAGDDAPFTITSTYRSYADQVTTYTDSIATLGSTDLADSISARAGYSEHQTGFAVDLASNGCVMHCFANTPQYTWLQAHAAEYGFIQRYYAGHEAMTGYNPEVWHYRYVGRDTALDMQKKGIKTLEEYWGISGGNYPN